MPTPPILDAAGVAPHALCEAFNAAFADYLIGPPSLRLADWPGFLARQGVALDASRVVAEGAQVRAFALVGRMGRRSRLATMGARPEARGSGAAPRLLDHVLAEARARQDTSFELEVFARNTRALALYRSRGFEVVAELHGHVRAPHATVVEAGDGPPQAVSAADAAAWLDAQAIDGLPFQVSGAALIAQSAQGQALEAWREGSAQIVFSVRDAVNVGVVSLVDTDPAQEAARRLLRALARQYPAATLRVPQLQRDDLGGAALAAEGWQRLELHQFLMRRDLAGRGDNPPA